MATKGTHSLLVSVVGPTIPQTLVELINSGYLTITLTTVDADGVVMPSVPRRLSEAVSAMKKQNSTEQMLRDMIVTLTGTDMQNARALFSSGLLSPAQATSLGQTLSSSLTRTGCWTC